MFRHGLVVMFRHGLVTRQGIDIPLARINSVEFRHGLVIT
jgi:hypothetical protein